MAIDNVNEKREPEVRAHLRKLPGTALKPGRMVWVKPSYVKRQPRVRKDKSR